MVHCGRDLTLRVEKKKVIKVVIKSKTKNKKNKTIVPLQSCSEVDEMTIPHNVLT